VAIEKHPLEDRKHPKALNLSPSLSPLQISFSILSFSPGGLRAKKKLRGLMVHAFISRNGSASCPSRSHYRFILFDSRFRATIFGHTARSGDG
jgi:hypothetical protein